MNIFVESKFDNYVDNQTPNFGSDDYQYIHDHDPFVDIEFYIDYSVSDSAKTLHLESSGISGMLWTTIENNTDQEPIDTSVFKENATVYIGKNYFIQVLNETIYRIVGNSRNDQIS